MGFPAIRAAVEEIMGMEPVDPFELTEATYRPGLLEDLQQPGFDEGLDRELTQFYQLLSDDNPDDDPPPSVPGGIEWWDEEDDELAA